MLFSRFQHQRHASGAPLGVYISMQLLSGVHLHTILPITTSKSVERLLSDAKL
jgi:hypothetical protein